MCISLVLAGPYRMMLEGLAHALEGSGDFSVQACLDTGDNVLRSLEQRQPDILVMDLSLTHRSGVALIEEIKTRNWKTRTVVFTDAPIEEVVRALALDVPGLVSKEKSKQELSSCIKKVHAGGKWLDRELSDKTMALLLEQQKTPVQTAQRLTPRELTVARMVTDGLPSKKIATKLFISEGTAKLHLHHIYQKLNCPGRMSLQRYMQQNGLA